MRLVHHHDDATSTSKRLVSGSLFTSSPRRGVESSSWVTWYVEDFSEKLLSTYCVNPAGKYFGMSPRS